MRRVLLSLFVLSLLPGGARAQNHWLEGEGSGVTLEYRRLRADDVDMDLLSGAYFLVGHYEIGRGGLQLVAELPWARIVEEEPLLPADEEGAESALGNLYVGVRQPARGGAGFDVGIRLPTADESVNSATFLGSRSSFMDRIGAYAPELLTIVAGVTGSTTPSAYAELRGRLGIVHLHYTGEGDVDDDALARLTGQAFATFDALRLGAGLETLYFLTGGEGNLGERSLVEGVIAAVYDFGPVAAGLQVRLPLDEDYQDFLDSMISLTVGVGLP